MVLSQDAEPLSAWVPSDRDEQGVLLTPWTCSVREESTFVVLSLGGLGGLLPQQSLTDTD